MNKRNIRAVIFDMDGVVVDTLQLHLESWKRVLPDMGISFTDIDYKRQFGQPARTILRELLTKRDHGREPTREEIEYWYRRKSELSCQMARHHLVPINGFLEFIRNVRAAGFPTALGSAASRNFVNAVLEKLQASSLFDAVVTVDDVVKPKPDPEIFLKSAEALRIPIKNCLIVEDSHPGIAAALASGGICCALLTTLLAEEIKTAHFKAPTYNDLWQWIHAT